MTGSYRVHASNLNFELQKKMAKAEIHLDYSNNELFDEMVDKDPTGNCWLCGEGHKQVKSYFLFKFMLTNGLKRVTCISWGDELINAYKNEIKIGSIVDGAKSKTIVLTETRRQEGFIAFELIIQINTSVTYHGQHRRMDAAVEVLPQEVTFEEIGQAEGRRIKI
ncbi:hypothetical protein TSAR_016917 [Trichomalopsis sarcophagae]|uniref:Uncharacterized protein n=1 Tax=Trichomalopsis sarcophagae TaxID=543379 RepID=A0A232F4N9_9HYME|nr:hypothetical protein TSAR_016917 [Trichomalopsis sarcophagae]